jgi:hypothetical protein
MATSIDPEDLAELRGCDLFNDCWRECVEAAQQTIEDDSDPDELARAERYLAERAARHPRP